MKRSCALGVCALTFAFYCFISLEINQRADPMEIEPNGAVVVAAAAED